MSHTLRRCASLLPLALGCALPAGLAAQTVAAQTAVTQTAPAATTLVEPPAPLLPASLGTLQRIGPAEDGDGFNQVDAADAAAMREDGLRRFARAQYTPDGREAAGAQTQHGTVMVYQFGDVSGALAGFDYFWKRRTTGRAAKLGEQSGTDACCVVFRSGVNVVREDINRGGEPLMQDLITRLPKVSGRRALSPLLPTLLPAAGVESDTARYALGPAGYQAEGGVLPPDELGWDKSLEAETVETRGGRGRLTLLLYPTPQIAGDRGRAIEKTINEGGRAKYGTVKLRRVGPLVGMASGDLSAEQAQALVSALSLHQEVSFDQKMPLEFHAEVRKTASLLQNIAVLSGVLILGALLLGLFLGGARAGVRVLMGKPAATEPEFLTIDLHGQAKPLRSETDELSRHG